MYLPNLFMGTKFIPSYLRRRFLSHLKSLSSYSRPVTRALGSEEKLRKALASPNSHKSQAFLHETHEYLRRIIIKPAFESAHVYVKAVCDTNGELIGLALGRMESAKINFALNKKPLYLCYGTHMFWLFLLITK